MTYLPMAHKTYFKEPSEVQEDQPQKTSRSQRPLSVTLVALIVLFITLLHLIRLFRAIYLWDFLADLPGISPLYLILTGLIWSLIGLPLGWWIWRGHPRSLKITRIVALAYTMYYWLDRILVAEGSVERPNDAFVAGLNVMLLAFIFWTLSRPQIIRFLHDARR
jgi:hypothetical protein